MNYKSNFQYCSIDPGTTLPTLYTHEHAKNTKPNSITIIRTTSLDTFIVPPVPPLVPTEIPPPRDDIVISGVVVVNLPKARRARLLRVSFIGEARLMFPKRQFFEDDIIFERSLDIGDDEDGLFLDAGPQAFSFSFVLPPDMAGYERSTHGRINHRLEAVLMGQPPKKFGGFFSASSPTRQMSTSPSKSSFLPRQPSPGPSRILSTENLDSMAGLSLSPPPDSPTYSASFEAKRREAWSEVKWLQHNMSTQLMMFICPIASPDRQAIQLDFRKRMVVPSLGSWTWALESDTISVGSYIVLKSSLVNAFPGASIWMLKLIIAQKVGLKSPRRPDEPETVFPPTKLTLWESGKLPSEEGSKPLWTNRAGTTDHEEFGLMQVCRVPDENTIRPSTCAGTITPIHMSHDIMLHVYFSIEGQDANNNPTNKPSWGQVRRAELITPIVLPNCACTKQNLQLPTYAESTAKHNGVDGGLTGEGLSDHCACGEPLETLAGRELSRAAKEFALSGVLGEDEEERGRQREGGERRKTEYSPVSTPGV